MDISRWEALDLLRNADAKEVDKENFTGNLLLKDVPPRHCR